MKTTTTAIFLTTLALTGCAHTGYYQQGYTGYSSDYSTGYGGGYTVDSYYTTPAPSYYYQPGGVYTYDEYYLPGYPSRHHHYDHDRDHGRDHDRDRPRHENWLHGGPRQGSNQSIFQGGGVHEGGWREGGVRGGRERWNSNAQEQRRDNLDRAVDRAQRQHHEPRVRNREDSVVEGPQQQSRGFSYGGASPRQGGHDMSGESAGGGGGRGHRGQGRGDD